MNRRDAMKVLGASAVTLAAQPADSVRAAAVARNDAGVEAALAAQHADGSIPDQYGFHQVGSASGLAEGLAASYAAPESRYHNDRALLERIARAAGFLERAQSPQGNIDGITTNFNSPPDTGFVVHGAATAAAICPPAAALLKTFLVKAAGGMTVGGVHTPNHRWVVCSALAQVNELFPDARYIARINQWLREGIDIDADGQYTERSTVTYNSVTNRALAVMAAKLKRPELLDPVRRNLNAMLYFLHADGEVVTEISRRQDQYARGNMSGYWFPLTYLAILDGNGQYATISRRYDASLSTLLEYPMLEKPLPASAPLPDRFEKHFAELGVARIRRGPLSATLTLGGSSRFFTLRYGDAVIEAVRFATAFFGKGQFVPTQAVKQSNTYVFRQSLEAPYYQPIDQHITTETWADTRSQRRQSEICRLEQSAEITEISTGFKIRIRASGTPGVPLAIEIVFRENPQSRNRINVQPIVMAHQYTDVRGAEPKLPGRAVHLTGFTPFDHTFFLDCV